MRIWGTRVNTILTVFPGGPLCPGVPGPPVNPGSPPGPWGGREGEGSCKLIFRWHSRVVLYSDKHTSVSPHLQALHRFPVDPLSQQLQEDPKRRLLA